MNKSLPKHLNGSVSLNITQFKCVFFFVFFLFFWWWVGENSLDEVHTVEYNIF